MSRTEPAPKDRSGPDPPRTRRYLLVANPRAGADQRELLAVARERLGEVEPFDLVPGADLERAVAQAARESRVVIAAGGDGTINSVVQHLVGRGTLGILPGGTFNHLARDLGIRDPEVALDALARGREARIDVGEANGRYFVNNAGMGLYPEGVREREDSRGRWGTIAASLRAAFRLLRRARPLVGTIEADGDRRVLFAWGVFVGNNRFGTAPGRIGTRERIDEGVLDLRVLTGRRRAAGRARIAWRKVKGKRLWRTRRLVRKEASRVVVTLSGRPRPTARDGEQGEWTDRLEVRILPGALRVLVPE